MNSVDDFLKRSKWRKELEALRSFIIDCELNEEVRWDQPCYTYNKKNIVILGELKDRCVLGFFKGALINDEKNILEKPGKNSQSVRMLSFTTVMDVVNLEQTIKSYIYEAIEIEKAGLKVRLKKTSAYPVPEELGKKFKKSAALKKAFNELTPGRQRGYLLFFSQAKQSTTRESRIERSIPNILKGIGHNEYRNT